MTLQFQPALLRDADIYELPRPVHTVRIQDSWNYLQFQIPLQDGDHTAGHSQGGVDIALEGHIGSQEGHLKLTEHEMFLELERLRENLDVHHSDPKYSLILYYDAEATMYRYFKECSTIRFESDISNPRLFDYAITIHACNPSLFQTMASA